MQLAYYSSDISEFLKQSPQTVLGHLTEHHAHDLNAPQRNAWLGQITVLQDQLQAFPEGSVAFEFSIPRMGKRVDIVVIYRGIIFIIEFKVGTPTFDAAAIDQVTDYALDLKNFHAGSHERRLVPVVVASRAPDHAFALQWSPDGIASPLLCNEKNLAQAIEATASLMPPQPALSLSDWLTSGYKPTPTIIEAAQALYRGHKVEEITRSDAGARNLSATTTCIAEIIENAKRSGHKAICFVTGVPGAGKTLAGLNLATERKNAHQDEHAVFLSGNGPLVDVLREALARDEVANGNASKKSEAERKVKGFIQNIHHFRDANLVTNDAPIERVAIFDEAQRAWNRDQASKFMAARKGIVGFDQSEPAFLISVMDRHQDWCTIVCLIGGGQEINVGEAGLTEWFSALQTRFSDWKIFTSPQLVHRDYHWGQDLGAMLEGLDCKTLPDLHLSVSIRSFRAERVSDFVGAVIAGELENARSLYDEIKSSYPIVLTRDLQKARAWLREQSRGSERTGLVASSGGHRLKPEGINVGAEIEATNWFLNAKSDVRSSYYLEDVATEFDIQGLELDWVGVCWDADFRYVGGQWTHLSFKGTKWQNVNSETRRTYLANAYRVLLTRARQGVVIFIPPGDVSDPTRPPAFYDGTTDFLKGCGIKPI